MDKWYGWEVDRNNCLTVPQTLLSLSQESILQLARTLAQVLHGETPPCLGPFSMASPEEIQALMFLKAQLEPQWKLLQVAGEEHRGEGVALF